MLFTSFSCFLNCDQATCVHVRTDRPRGGGGGVALERSLYAHISVTKAIKPARGSFTHQRLNRNIYANGYPHTLLCASRCILHPRDHHHITSHQTKHWRPAKQQTLTRKALLRSFSSFPMAATVVISLQIDAAILSDIAKRLPASVSPTHPRPGMRCLQPLSRVPASAQSATLCWVVGSFLAAKVGPLASSAIGR